ncbi:MAG: M23 family metallopeptidase [Rhodospirillaceae bacterium]|nr:M23 family metallopeptidase [Rhodospirillaceae bacterium]
MARWVLAFMALLIASTIRPAIADPAFALPAACALGKDCFVQNYVDMDATPAAADFSCGGLTYDGHKGTDIRLTNYVAMEQGVNVLAAAPGTVLRLRDGMDDVSVRDTGADAVKDRMAGNSVIVDHGDGWVTQYAHLKKGSISVVPGQQVATGDRLGQIGLSGHTEFPHLHFEVRHKDQSVDPFTGDEMGAGCGVTGEALWQPALTYQPSGLLTLGFSTEKPDAEAARHGAYDAAMPTAESGALVFWADFFGLQQGDELVQQLVGPDGAILSENRQTAVKSKVQFFSFVGLKKPGAGWRPGTYRGTLRLLRGNAAGSKQTAEISIP